MTCCTCPASPRATISLQPVDLGAEAAAIAAGLQRQDPGRRVCFTIQQQARAMADADLIREVLHHLLDNAWKFTSGRDNATIEFGMTPATDARVCCYVRDNGAGFDPAFAHKLFQPFQRLHTTQEFPGTGIGLASVRQIVDRHSGRTWAEGTVGDGATSSSPSRPPNLHRGLRGGRVGFRVADGQPAVGVEELEVVGVDGELDRLVGPDLGPGGHPGGPQ